MGKKKPGRHQPGALRSAGRTPKKKCCQKRTRCSRCPIRMLAEGTLPPGLTVKRRRLVRVGTEARDVRPVTMLRVADAPSVGASLASPATPVKTGKPGKPVKLGKKARKKAAKRARKLAAAA